MTDIMLQVLLSLQHIDHWQENCAISCKLYYFAQWISTFWESTVCRHLPVYHHNKAWWCYFLCKQDWMLFAISCKKNTKHELDGNGVYDWPKWVGKCQISSKIQYCASLVVIQCYKSTLLMWVRADFAATGCCSMFCKRHTNSLVDARAFLPSDKKGTPRPTFLCFLSSCSANLNLY